MIWVLRNIVNLLMQAPRMLASKAGCFPFPSALDLERISGVKNAASKFLIKRVGMSPLESTTSSSWRCLCEVHPVPGHQLHFFVIAPDCTSELHRGRRYSLNEVIPEHFTPLPCCRVRVCFICQHPQGSRILHQLFSWLLPTGLQPTLPLQLVPLWCT